jgi:sugar phosphate isomerase/epimerase
MPWEAITSALHQTGYDAALLLIESFNPDNQTIARAAIWRPLAETRDRPARDGLAFLHGSLA